MDWEIVDDDGMIHSGTEEEMRAKFSAIENGEEAVKDARGDIKLVQVHGRIA